jgi:hypothetical protein
MHKKGAVTRVAHAGKATVWVNLVYCVRSTLLRSKKGFKVNKKFFSPMDIANELSIRFCNHFYPFSRKCGKSMFC